MSKNPLSADYADLRRFDYGVAIGDKCFIEQILKFSFNRHGINLCKSA